MRGEYRVETKTHNACANLLRRCASGGGYTDRLSEGACLGSTRASRCDRLRRLRNLNRAATLFSKARQTEAQGQCPNEARRILPACPVEQRGTVDHLAI